MHREYRFDDHIAACVAAGLDGVEANMLTELWVGWTLSAYTASRAWAPEVMDAAADRLRARGLIEGAASATPAGGCAPPWRRRPTRQSTP